VTDHPRELSDTLAAHLLGALDERERAEFERHLEACERCRDEAASLRAAVDALAAAAPPVEPSPALKGRLMSVVEREADLLSAAGAKADRPERRRRGLGGLFPRPALTAGLAAGAVAMGVLGGVLLSGGGEGTGQGGERTVQARITDPALSSTARASLVVEGGRASLVLRGMPAPPRGRTWQAWVQTPGRPPVSAGAFEVRSGTVVLTRPVRPGDLVLVTGERDGGNTTPTSNPTVRSAHV
jgi:anti-sigma-K factor RskA